jgi:hypothetical protein
MAVRTTGAFKALPPSAPSSPVAIPRPVRGPILPGCSDEALVAYVTLALRGLVEEVELSTLSIRKPPAFLLVRKVVAELDNRARGQIPSQLDCHCGSPTCPGCDEAEALISKIPALDPGCGPVPTAAARTPLTAHHAASAGWLRPSLPSAGYRMCASVR